MSSERARAQVAEVVQRAPVPTGFAERNCWWLDGVRQAIAWLCAHCLSTVWRTLHQYGLGYKHGRRHVHSPDTDYDVKPRRVATIAWYGCQAPQQIVRL